MFLPPDNQAAQTPELKMVRAALFLFLKDADDYLHEKLNADKKLLIEQKNAFNDLLRCGKMTKQIAELNQLDAHYISEHFRGYVRRYYSEEPKQG